MFVTLHIYSDDIENHINGIADNLLQEKILNIKKQLNKYLIQRLITSHKHVCYSPYI